MRAGAAITGLGAISAIGNNPAEMLVSLRAGRAGITEIETFSTEGLRIRHAAEIKTWKPSDHFSQTEAKRLDKTAQLGIVAARQAVADAGLTPSLLRSGRVALVFGLSGGGIGGAEGPGLQFCTQLFLEALATQGPEAERALLERHRDSAIYVQTQEVAADLGITGPCLSISNACAASTSAMSSALTLLDADRADVVIIGGSDAWSRFNYAGFYSLGAMAERPMSPFSRGVGVLFGEGAGCIVVERPQGAIARGAKMRGLLLGCGDTSDAHHITAPNPAGDGLVRAMRLALQDAGLPTTAIGYINAHGTGTPDNDVMETVAIHRVFQGHEPPVSSTKSIIGHTLGAAGTLEFIASLLAMNDGFLPPTLNFEEARPGCDLDYVPNVPRPAQYDHFLSLSSAFGGVNAVAIGARAAPTIQPTPSPPKGVGVTVTGIGVVSPVGFGAEAFRSGLRAGVPGIKPITRFSVEDMACRNAALIGDLPARKLAPAADTRRMDAITRFAVVAATLALKDAGLVGRVPAERIGLHMAMTHGPAGSLRLFGDALAQDGIAGLSAKLFAPIVYSTIGGQVCQSCQLRGAGFTLIDGVGAGLVALAHAYDFLRLHDELDAIVVVAADECPEHVHWSYDRLGNLSPNGEVALYDENGAGLVLGEGGAALVLERSASAAARGARRYGRISGAAYASEGRSNEDVDETGAGLADAAARALAAGGIAAPDIVYGLARGVARHDRREANALRQVLRNRPVPVTSLTGQLGVASATSGLYAAAAALLGMQHGEAYATMGTGDGCAGLDVICHESRVGTFDRALIAGSSQYGNSSAVLLDRNI